MPAVALTDHGTLGGVVKFYDAARKEGIKPIIGLELYVATDRRSRAGVKERNAHLTLLARDQTGYQNLVKLSTRAYLEGYYYKPRADWDLLAEHSEGLIALTGCMSGRIAMMLRDGDEEGAVAEVRRLADLLGPENVFVELQDAGLQEQRDLLPKQWALAQKAGLRTVATNDVHYLRHEDAYAHDALLCIQTQSNLDDEKRMRYGSDEFYLKSGEEMYERFKDYPGSCEATVEIAARCDVDLDFGTYLLPSYPVPEGYTEATYLRELCEHGMLRRYGGDPAVRGARAPRLRARRHRRDGLRRLLPHRLGLRQVRQGQRHRRGTRPRVGRRVHRELLPEHHRHRPAQVRPALRALPQPGAQEHARRRHGLQREAPRRRHRLRGAQVRARQGRADHHLRHHGRARRRARRGARHGQAVRRRRQDRQDDPRGGPAGHLRPGHAAGRRAQAGLRRRRGGQAGRRPRHEPRGTHPQRLHPRRRRGHQRQAAHRVPAAAAEGRRRARHAVRHGRRRQARPAQDGLPRPAQPRRHRVGPGDHRVHARRVHRDRPAPAGRREDVQDARQGRLHRRVPVREPRHEGGAARDRPHASSRTSSPSWRSTARGPCSTSPRTRATRRTRPRSSTTTRPCAPSWSPRTA